MLYQLHFREPGAGGAVLTATDAALGQYNVEYPTNGDYIMTCTATDSDGLTASQDVTVQVYYRKCNLTLYFE